MSIRRFKEHASKKFVKIVIGICIYLLFTIYAVDVYHNIPATYTKVHAFVNERFLSDKKNIIVGNTMLLVDVADTPEERIKGLSRQAQLPARTGMLFIFEKPGIYGFWMKEMNFDIDIIWFNEYGEIIYFIQDVQPESFPETFMPPRDILYALEVPAGFIKKEGLKIGDKIDLY